MKHTCNFTFSVNRTQAFKGPNGAYKVEIRGVYKCACGRWEWGPVNLTGVVFK